jgi:hypothetical protein
VFLDGRALDEHDYPEIRRVICSGDGRRVAYVARCDLINDMQFEEMVVGGEVQQADFFDEVLFSADGRRYGSVSRYEEFTFVTVEGEGEDHEHSQAGALCFSPDGARYAYRAQDYEQVRPFWRVVSDGRREPAYQEVGEPLFSADGQRLAYVAVKEGGACVVADGREGERHDGIARGTLRFSPDGRHLAYMAASGGKQWVVLDGLSQAASDAAWPVAFSPDNRVAYPVRQGSQYRVIVDGEAGEPFDGIGGDTVSFSADGRHFAYEAGRAGKWLVVLDGREGHAYRGIGKGTPLFSPVGAHLAYAAWRDEGWSVVLNGVEGPLYDRIGSLQFSPDGRHMAYTACRGPDHVLVVDEQESDAFAAACGPVAWQGSYRVVVLMIHEGSVVLLEGDVRGETV